MIRHLIMPIQAFPTHHGQRIIFFIWISFQEHWQITGLQGKGEAISITLENLFFFNACVFIQAVAHSR